MKQHNLISSVVFLAIAAAVVFEASKLPFGSINVPQMGFFPLILSILLVIFSLILLGQSIYERDKNGKHSEAKGGSWNKIYLTLGALFAYSFLLEPVGYLVSTFLLVAFLSRAIWPQRWWVVIVLAFSSTLVSFLIFGLLLGTSLPAGILP